MILNNKKRRFYPSISSFSLLKNNYVDKSIQTHILYNIKLNSNNILLSTYIFYKFPFYLPLYTIYFYKNISIKSIDIATIIPVQYPIKKLSPRNVLLNKNIIVTIIIFNNILIIFSPLIKYNFYIKLKNSFKTFLHN